MLRLKIQQTGDRALALDLKLNGPSVDARQTASVRRSIAAAGRIRQDAALTRLTVTQNHHQRVNP